MAEGRPPFVEAAGDRPPLWLCSLVAMWLCGYVAMCSYVAMWLYGYVAMRLLGYAMWPSTINNRITNELIDQSISYSLWSFDSTLMAINMSSNGHQ